MTVNDSNNLFGPSDGKFLKDINNNDTLFADGKNPLYDTVDNSDDNLIDTDTSNKQPPSPVGAPTTKPTTNVEMSLEQKRKKALNYANREASRITLRKNNFWPRVYDGGILRVRQDDKYPTTGKQKSKIQIVYGSDLISIMEKVIMDNHNGETTLISFADKNKPGGEGILKGLQTTSEQEIMYRTTLRWQLLHDWEHKQDIYPMKDKYVWSKVKIVNDINYEPFVDRNEQPTDHKTFNIVSIADETPFKLTPTPEGTVVTLSEIKEFEDKLEPMFRQMYCALRVCAINNQKNIVNDTCDQPHKHDTDLITRMWLSTIMRNFENVFEKVVIVCFKCDIQAASHLHKVVENWFTDYKEDNPPDRGLIGQISNGFFNWLNRK